MLGEADLVGIFGVRIVRVDGLRTVRVLGWLGDFTAIRVDRRGRAGGGCRGRAAATEATRRLSGIALGAGGSAGVSGDGRRGLEAAQLGGGVHLRGVAGSHGLGASTERAGHGTAAAVRAGLFLVQGEGVDEATMRSLRGGTEVEDPDDDDHRQQNETSTGGLFSALRAVDGVVGADGGQDESGTQVSYNRDAVEIPSVGTEGEDQANVDTEHVGNRPPIQIRIVGLDVGDDG